MAEKEKIQKLNKDSNKYYQVGTLVYLVAQYADEIYDVLGPEDVSGLMKYIFGDITLYNGKMQYKYKEPFKVCQDPIF